MKARYSIALSMFAGLLIGGVSVGGLYAQSKPYGAYAVVDFTNFGDAAEFKKNVGEPSPAVIKKYGGTFVARTDSVTMLRESDQPVVRYVIIGFNNVQRAQSWWHSDEWKPIATYLQQHTEGRAFVAEAVKQ